MNKHVNNKDNMSTIIIINIMNVVAEITMYILRLNFPSHLLLKILDILGREGEGGRKGWGE